jgi:hypothetical protein
VDAFVSMLESLGWSAVPDLRDNAGC